MIREENEIRFQACNICAALLRNINDNFLSVSFEIINRRDVQVKIILEKHTEVEESYINDFTAELAALQIRNCVNVPQIDLGKDKLPLKNLVYKKVV